MAITKRCIRCRKKVREDGTCQNQNCVLYVPEVQEEPVEEQPEQEEPKQEEPATEA